MRVKLNQIKPFFQCLLPLISPPNVLCNVTNEDFFFFDNRGTFHGQTLRTFHEDTNLRVLTAPQQPVPAKFKVSSVIGFEPRIMCHLLGLHFPVFKLTNWATLTDIKLLLILYTHYYPLSPILLLKFMESRYFYVQVTLKLMEKFHHPYCQMEEYLNHPKCNFVINMP